MADRMGYDIDESRWPLLVARATRYLGDPEAADASYRALELILKRDERFMVVFDMRGASSSPARRRKFLEWGERNEHALTRLVVAGAVVVSSSIERGFVTASLWLRTPPFPLRVFGDASEAEAWLMKSFAHLTTTKSA